ncbi:GIY-YIG nuclease family protein [Pontimicrobium aquaticum]|uniref:GIY-YIG nuclease family protein n=1 Tax=Pontimicrobium aquaticum TaxID=2565367 RepID=A0A4U0F164_9FLAO|nr:GIY-YIG nuclease family protein [Pontimicrobium aquaticum]TJY38157.1 GIY-YIG nuclease family protein [Pontimicrobium aquaticum]
MPKVTASHNYYVYIITNKNKTVLYIGVTNNLKERIFYHSNPEPHSKSFSHKYKCKYLIYFEHFLEIEDAIKREKQLKKWSRAKKERLINLKNPDWTFLNDTV